MLHDTFEDVLNRFSQFLDRSYSHGQPNKGLVIIDQAHREQYRESFTEFKRRGTAFQGQLKNIIDIPYFAGRLDTRMIQLADFTAYAVFRYYNHQDASYFQ